MTETVLVTGGAGYIGSHVCAALAAAGYLPVTYDNFCRGNRWAVRFGPLEEGDTGDGERLRAVMRAYRPAAVVHMAAFAYVGESVETPGLYYRNNVANSLTLLEAMADQGIRRIVFSSTCAVYGEAARVPIHEGDSTEPINPYGRSKLMVERMLADFGRSENLRSIVLRYFNAAGADPQGRIGEAHDPETHVIPLILDAALGGAAFNILGDDYPTPDGTCIRDYIHVTDLAEAHRLAVENLLADGVSATFNLGTGRGSSVRELLDAAEDVVGGPIPVGRAARRPGDPATLVAAPGRVASVLGWRPARSDIRAIMADAWAWHRRLRAGSISSELDSAAGGTLLMREK